MGHALISVLVDTNVVLDVLLDRQPRATHSTALVAYIEAGRMRGFLSAHSVTTIHYLLRRELGESRARKVAHHAHCGFIVTRDPRGFKGSPVKSISPETANALVSAS